MSTVTFISFRLGLTDGVSVVAAMWAGLFAELGHTVRTVAGAGPVDVTVPELAIDAGEPPAPSAVRDALDGSDLVVVENLLSIPLRPDASAVVAGVLAGRPALLHHHDPPWQRERFAHVTALPPDDPAWAHVVINDLTRHQFAARGLAATTIHNGFDPDDPPGDRARTRGHLGVSDDTLLVLHPVRAIARKQVPTALDVCARLGGVYWLPGGPEEGYGAELDDLLATAPVPVLRHPVEGRMADAYAACDAVVFPSSWEGFGNPPVEASIHHRPVLVGDYPVGAELMGYGFRWFGLGEVDALAEFVADPDEALLEHNHGVVRRHFSRATVRERLVALLAGRGWRRRR